MRSRADYMYHQHQLICTDMPGIQDRYDWYTPRAAFRLKYTVLVMLDKTAVCRLAGNPPSANTTHTLPASWVYTACFEGAPQDLLSCDAIPISLLKNPCTAIAAEAQSETSHMKPQFETDLIEFMASKTKFLFTADPRPASLHSRDHLMLLNLPFIKPVAQWNQRLRYAHHNFLLKKTQRGKGHTLRNDAMQKYYDDNGQVPHDTIGQRVTLEIQASAMRSTPFIYPNPRSNEI